MRKNNEQKSLYTTLDSYQAGFLYLRKHNVEFLEQGSKWVFVFNATDKLRHDLQDYSNGALVEAAKFAFAIKTLKSQIHSMRRDKAYGLQGINQA